MEIISKELLSEVLGVKVSRFEYVCDEDKFSDGERFIVICDDMVPFISPYELAHKCKEWAYKQGYFISFFPQWLGVASIRVEVFKINGAPVLSEMIDRKDIEGVSLKYFDEPKYVFKYAQWILDNKDAK